MATSRTGQFTSAAWGPKQYILAATAVTLAVSAVAIVTSVVLSPARIVFSVTDVASTTTNLQVQGSAAPALLLNFTLDAANPSRRAGVEYSSVTARLRLHSESHRMARWVQADVHKAMPLLQPPGSSSSFRVSAVYFQKSLVARNITGAGGIRASRAPQMTVLVVAQVRFRIGLAYSRPYDVQVSCQPVDFFIAAAAAAAARRIICVA